jgi:hypothetical protein
VNAAAWQSDLVALGDNGEISFSAAGIPLQLNTTGPDVGGNDSLTGGSGNDILVGGAGNDTLSGGAGNDIMAGDNAKVVWTAGGVGMVESTSPTLGGNDTLNAGSGNNILIGGAGNDLFFGSMTNDLIIGDNGHVTFDGKGLVQGVTVMGPVTSDLIAFTQNGLFRAPATATHDVRPVDGNNLFGDGKNLSVSGSVRSADGYASSKPEAWQCPELTYHHGNAELASLTDFFVPVEEGEEEDGVIPADVIDEDAQVFDNVINASCAANDDIQVQAGMVNNGTGVRGAKGQNANIKLGTLVAGFTGWKINNSARPGQSGNITRKSLEKLERDERNRRFRKWL